MDSGSGPQKRCLRCDTPLADGTTTCPNCGQTMSSIDPVTLASRGALADTSISSTPDAQPSSLYEQTPYGQTLPFYEQTSSYRQAPSYERSSVSDIQAAPLPPQPLVPMPSPPPPKTLSPWLIGALIVGLVVLVGGSALYIASYNIGLARIHTDATATVQTLQATAMPQLNATATATALVDPHIPAGVNATQIINDPLTQAGNWQSSTGCQFQADGYHVSSPVMHLGACYEPFSYVNSSFQVGVKLLKGTCVGLGTRIHGSVFTGYITFVCNDNSCGIAFINNGAETILGTSTTTVFHSAPDQENILTLVTNKQTLEFYVNGTKLSSATDSRYIGPGMLSLLSASNSNLASEVVFDHAKVWTF